MKYPPSEKEAFIDIMKAKTKKFAVDIVLFCENLPPTSSCRNISFQLICSETSTGANYRATCRARSKAEFHSKISIVVEEADESLFWLEVIDDANILCNKNELKRLQEMATEIIKVTSRARKTNSKKE
jgi:four helix bundle protein